MYNLSESIINEISAIACRYDVEKIVLFGSRAKGTNSKTSDIDLAVYGGNVAMFSLDIEEEVRTLLMFDVVDMNREVSAELRSEIEKYGVVIYENFCKALGNLKIGTQLEPPYTIVEQTGIVGLFEICFEQSWKLMKELLELHGRHEASSGSPRQIIKIAFQSGMITDEDAWLELLEVRNLLAHTYSDEQTLDSIKKIKADFVSVFEKLKIEINDNWLI